MPDTAALPDHEILLEFTEARRLAHVDDPIRKDLSTATRAGDSLFLSCDETAGIERLTPVAGSGGRHWGNHRHFNLGRIIDLPDGPKGEMDIEGLYHDADPDGGWLWVCGSHSLKRKQPRHARDTPEASLARMARIGRDPNRYFLGRLPLVRKRGGMAPVLRDGARQAAWVKLKRHRSKLLGWLSDDPHLGAFLGLPSKENGLDIEGVAADGLRVWLGLRGPVLRGHAVVIEMRMKLTGKGHLKPRRIDGDRRYRKHLIPTGGQGIRDLTIDGRDLVILTGPALAGDGAAEVLLWRGALDHEAGATHPPERVTRLAGLPYRGGLDHPEGLVPWPEAARDGRPAWLVAYDSPDPVRLGHGPTCITADIWHPETG
ncbi:DUF3616 domain-containing protein [Frigidibacter sp. MR17.24]|uniref:DUF3616 domain-containing protein n=1 Tax=Frigidibacter sp. MR17.24 TaxID=3127345 RepID=UPI003012DCB0